jgi:tryptophanase
MYEPYRIKTVEPLPVNTAEKRKVLLEEARYNPFLLPADQVPIDLLTDSGTSAMSQDQWGGLLAGDEAYAGARSWKRMEGVIQELTGHPYILPVHQGRAGERILYGELGGAGKRFFSNTHFDTTRGNIEFTGGEAVDLPVPEGLDLDSYHPFKGNMDIGKLRQELERTPKEKLGAVILTVTNNSGGGQPVSMANVKAVEEVCRDHDLPFVIDACRVAENAWFIRQREEGFSDRHPYSLAQEILGRADAVVMSAKKDGLANMGGFLALKDEGLFEACRSTLIITEGFPTYGGLSGRDMEAIAIGLQEVFEPSYLEHRTGGTRWLGESLREGGVPLMWPIGGHAVYLDAERFFPELPKAQYPGQLLACELYRLGGVRGVEIGSVMFGRYDEEGGLIPSPYELVRLAIPRRVYTKSHLEHVRDTVLEIFKGEGRNDLDGLRIVRETPFLRHFSAHFEPIPKADPQT